jgi:6-phosphofructokinase 2
MPGPELSASEAQAILDRFYRTASTSTLAVASGSLPRGLGDDFWSKVAERAKKARFPLLLDSSAGADAALEAGLFLLRLDRDEIDALVGKPLDWPKGIADWASAQIERGACEMVIATHGDAGALLVSKTERIRIAPPKVEVCSAVGAGDSFVGAFSLAWSEGQPAADALRRAVAAAAATLLTPGTELCRKEDVERLVDQCGAAEPV